SDLTQDAAYDRHLEHDRIDVPASFRRFVIEADTDRSADQSDKCRDAAPASQEAADAHYDACWERQGLTGAQQPEEYLFKLRDDHDHDQRDRTDRNEYDGRRVNRCRNDASLQFYDLFDEYR